LIFSYAKSKYVHAESTSPALREAEMRLIDRSTSIRRLGLVIFDALIDWDYPK